MKKIICNICGEQIGKYERFKIRVSSKYFDVSDFTAHFCTECFDKFLTFIAPREGEEHVR